MGAEKPQKRSTRAVRGEGQLEWKQEIDFPEDPLERLGLVLSGAINSGPKSTLMMLIPPYGYIETADLGTSFRKATAGSRVDFDDTNANLSAYCESSLAKVGLVAQVLEVESAGIKIPIGYYLTEAGKTYGTRAAALALHFEHENKDMSIYSIFGQTATQSEEELRAPALRSQILSYLYDNQGKSTDVPTMMKFFPKYNPILIESVLTDLQDQECLTCVDLDRPKHLVYSRTDKALKPARQVTKMPGLKNKVIQASEQIWNEKGHVAIDDLSAVLYPQLKDGWKDEVVLKVHIRTLMKALAKEGYFTVEESGWHESDMTAHISEKGRRVYEGLIHPLLLLMQDNVPFTEEFDKTIMKDVKREFPLYAQEALDRYYPHSQGYTRKRMVDFVDPRILRSLTTAQELGLTINEISAVTHTKVKSLGRRLAQLKKAGKISSIGNRTDRDYRYFISPLKEKDDTQ